MKPFCLPPCATLLVSLLLLPAVVNADSPAKGGLRYSVAVERFENRSGWSGQFNIGHTWGALLTDSLMQTGRFIVLGEADMRGAAMAEQDFARSGRTAGGDRAPATGQMTPAQLLVKGEITHFQASTSGGQGGVRIQGFRVGGSSDQAEINVVVYVVDTTTGQVVASKRVVGEAKRSGLNVGFTDRNWGADLGGFKKTNVGVAVEQAIDQAVEFISAQIGNMPWTGAVVLVRGEQVYINRGEREGIVAGQTFKVGTSEAIRDPGTGELLDVVIEEKATIKVATVRDRLSICTIVSGEGIEPGMTVMLP
jgi:curli biogenesis system outer membrane secretion channel CsgG